jgi:hypothetical protein
LEDSLILKISTTIEKQCNACCATLHIIIPREREPRAKFETIETMPKNENRYSEGVSVESKYDENLFRDMNALELSFHFSKVESFVNKNIRYLTGSPFLCYSCSQKKKVANLEVVK